MPSHARSLTLIALLAFAAPAAAQIPQPVAAPAPASPEFLSRYDFHMSLYRLYGADDPERSPLLAGRSHLHPAVHRVQNAVCERPREEWDVPALAEVAHVTPRHLARLFKEHAGVSPRDYVEQVRRGLAEQALARGLSTPQALELAGFGNDRQWRRARARSRAQDA